MDERGPNRFGRLAEAQPLWHEAPEIVGILAASETREEAREELLAYLEALESDVRDGAFDLDRIEWFSTMSALNRVMNMLSPENEAIAGFSTVGLLWAVARREGDEDVTEGFVEEFVHLFRAINGRSGIGQGWLGGSWEQAGEPTEGMPGSGQRAALARSRFLDRLSDVLWAGVSRYQTGLDPSVVRARERNRERILRSFDASGSDWDDPSWQATHVLKGEDGASRLIDLVSLKSEEIAAIRWAVRSHVPWGITPYYLSLFDFDSRDRHEDGQVRSQVIPPLRTVRAMIEHRGRGDRAMDFMRERDTSPIERVTRRYPAVAIFKVCDTCPQICSYCQRNWEIGDAMDRSRIPERDKLEPALRWFEEHNGIRDVLMTGGDPLLLDDELLGYLLGRFARMEHVQNLRIGTRVPVTLPMRITDNLARLLGEAIAPGRRNLEVVTHVESAYEVTPELATAVDRLRRHGVQVYNQQVYTAETSRRFQLVATRVALKRVGIDPYYTFYPKGKDEHRDYLVPIARILQERKEEARLLPGVYRTDEPVFNVPGLGKNHLRASQDRELIGIRSDGRRVYLFHPWEKGIVPVAPWPYVDVSIREYLHAMEDRGEDRADYESIWFYV